MEFQIRQDDGDHRSPQRLVVGFDPGYESKGREATRHGWVESFVEKRKSY
jgi:hypothetical protein